MLFDFDAIDAPVASVADGFDFPEATETVFRGPEVDPIVAVHDLFVGTRGDASDRTATDAVLAAMRAAFDRALDGRDADAAALDTEIETSTKTHQRAVASASSVSKPLHKAGSATARSLVA